MPTACLIRLLLRFCAASGLGWSVLALAGCETHPTRPPAARPASPPAPVAAAPAPPASSPPPPAAPPAPDEADEPAEPASDPNKPPYRLLPRRSIRYRRYVGWVGKRPVVFNLHVGNELEGESTLTLWGSCYDARRGTAGYFTEYEFNPRRPVHLRVDSDRSTAVEHWRAQQPLGPRLTGTVTVAGRPPRHFVLREDYHAGVPLVVRTAQMYQPPLLVRSEPYQHDPSAERVKLTTYYRRRYVQPLGAARGTLRRVLPSSPGYVRRWLRKALEDSDSFASTNEYMMRIDLNDYGILSYSKDVSYDYFGANHPDHLTDSFSCDLYTGRPITLASLLRPGSQAALQRLAGRYLAAQDKENLNSYYDSPTTATEKMEDVAWSSFRLNPVGLETESQLGPHAMGPTSITIPYAALRPLLRPRTPLNRVLVARGLRPVL